MEIENLSQLSTTELQEIIKKTKSNRLIGAVLIGFCIGVFVFSAVKNGWGFFTFFPLIIGFLMYKSSTKYNEQLSKLEQELSQRNAA